MRARSSWGATPPRSSATTSRGPTMSCRPRARRVSRRRSARRILSSARASSSTRCVGLTPRLPISGRSHGSRGWPGTGAPPSCGSGATQGGPNERGDDGTVLGQALRLALGDKKGIVRYGTSFVPMDEALVSASVDLSGRPFLVFGVPVARTRVSNFDLDLLQEFFRAFAFNAELTLHVTMHYGHNLHHITEAVFKAVGRALADATRLNPRVAGILPSTKGVL